LIDIEQLAFTYPDGTKALDGIDLYVGKGESLGIAGSNGRANRPSSITSTAGTCRSRGR